MQLKWLWSSLIGDASLQKPIGFALGIAVNSPDSCAKLANNSCPWLRRAVGKVVTPWSETYSHPSGSPGRLRITGSVGLWLGPLPAA